MSNYENRLVLSTNDSYRIVEENEIVLCQKQQDEVIVLLGNGEKLTVKKQLDVLSDKLSKDKFFFPNNDCLVNVDYVKRFEKHDSTAIIFIGENTVKVSSENKNGVIRFLSEIVRIQI